MKPIRPFAILLASIALSVPAQAASVVTGDIPSNVSPTFTTADGYLTLKGYADSASTVPANLTSAGPSTWFGVAGSDRMDSTETMTLQLAPGYGLTGFGDIWSRAVVSISGFTSDPGLNIGASAGVNSFGYSAGVLTLDLAWNGGGTRDFILTDVNASAGQLLTVSLDFATAPQLSFTHIDYAAVPEPTTMSLAVMGLSLLLVRRGTRR